jgi:hypothetical protein
MLKYTIGYDKQDSRFPYSIHLGGYDFYNCINSAKTYGQALEIATRCAKALKSANNGETVYIFFTDDFFAPAKEIARV